MPSFGIIVLNKNQESRYYRDIGNHAARYGMTVHRFIPNQMDPYTEQITGETFDPHAEEWKPATFPVPDVLYDRCFYTTREEYKSNAPIVEWLKNRTIFLGYGLPNKLKVYETLKDDGHLSPYTIESIKAEHARKIIAELEHRHTLVLKPESGSQGKGILFLEIKKDRIVVQSERRGKTLQKSFTDKKELSEWLGARLARTTFLIQPFLSLQTPQNQPFDIRILVKKDGDGNWIEHGRGVRIGKTGGLVSNLHSAGKIADFEEWLNSQPCKMRGFIAEELDSILSRVPPLLEKTFGPLFELGLDIGIDRDGAIWIIEANSKPGHETVIRTVKDSRRRTAEAPLQYAQYLLRQKEMNDHATTVSAQKNE